MGESRGGRSDGTEGWGPCNLKGQPFLGTHEGSGFSEVRNPDVCLKALDFYMSAINSDLKCHVGANPMQVESSPSVGVWPTGHLLCSLYSLFLFTCQGLLSGHVLQEAAHDGSSSRDARGSPQPLSREKSRPGGTCSLVSLGLANNLALRRS